MSLFAHLDSSHRGCQDGAFIQHSPLNTMSYSIYISYSMSDSSKAYDLSGKLSREKISYYLDCVESGFTLSDYTKQVIEECEAFVALVGMSYTEAKYSHDTLRHAIEHGKRIVVCPIEGAPLPELQVPCTTVNEENLLALLMGGNVDEDDNVDNDVDDNCLPDGLTVDRRPLTVDDKNDNDNDDDNCLPDGLTVDCRPLTVDYRQDEEESEVWEHRGTIPPMPEQPLQTKKKNVGCGCLIYAIFIFIISNFFVNKIFDVGLIDLAIELIVNK